MVFRSESSEKKGQKVLENLYYFSEDSMLDCNIYAIVSKSGEITLFDGGKSTSLQGLFKGMEKLNLDYKNITKIFLTHEHLDHVMGLYPLMEIMKDDPPEIFAYGETAKILTKGDESQIFPGNFGITAKMFGVKVNPLKVTDLKEFNDIEISSEYNFQIYYTPGHSLGSITYYEPSKKILIPGDLVFTGGSFGRFDFPGSSLKSLQDSIKLVNDLDVKYLLPGHMGISDIGNRQIEFSYRMVSSI